MCIIIIKIDCLRALFTQKARECLGSLSLIKNCVFKNCVFKLCGLIFSNVYHKQYHTIISIIINKKLFYVDSDC